MSIAVWHSASYDEPMNLANKVDSELKRRGWNKSDLARRAKVHPSVISRIVSGERLGRVDTVLRVCAALGMDADEVQRLLAGEPTIATPLRSIKEIAEELIAAADREEAERKERERAEEIARREVELRAQGLVGDVYRIPRAEQSASAGYGYTLDAEMTTMTGPAPKAEDRVSVKVTGDCMEPIVAQGAWVIVDKSRQPVHGDIVLVDHEGEWLCKAYNVDPDGQVWLRALQHREPIRPNGRTTVIGVVTSIQSEPPRIVIPPGK